MCVCTFLARHKLPHSLSQAIVTAILLLSPLIHFAGSQRSDKCKRTIQAHLIIALCFIVASQMFRFLQIEDKSLHQQKDEDSLDYDGLETNPECLPGLAVYNFL